VKRNTEAGNYGIAGAVLQDLERIAPPQFKEDVRKKIAACEEKEFQNTDKELEEIWKRDNAQIKFCWKTLDWIEDSHLQCSYCNALFKESDTVEEDDKCSYCLCGELVKKSL
jgi:ribosome recycling factor